jgi:hypothetical protein
MFEKMELGKLDVIEVIRTCIAITPSNGDKGFLTELHSR